MEGGEIVEAKEKKKCRKGRGSVMLPGDEKFLNLANGGGGWETAGAYELEKWGTGGKYPE